MRYGYARVSTEDQSLDIQIAELKAVGCEDIRFEKLSGSSIEKRPEFSPFCSPSSNRRRSVGGSDRSVRPQPARSGNHGGGFHQAWDRSQSHAAADRHGVGQRPGVPADVRCVRRVRAVDHGRTPRRRDREGEGRGQVCEVRPGVEGRSWRRGQIEGRDRLCEGGGAARDFGVGAQSPGRARLTCHPIPSYDDHEHVTLPVSFSRNRLRRLITAGSFQRGLDAR